MDMDLSRYQGLIFDMDGTLIDSMPAHITAWRYACEQFNIPFDPQWLMSLGGSPTIKTAQMMNEKYQTDHDIQEVADAKWRFFEALEQKGEAIPATVNLLLQYRDQKKVAVGTGCRKVNAENLLTITDILPLLDALVTADDVLNHKPHPDTFLEAANRIGLAPHQCVVFEDTDLGRRAALAAGMDCFLVVDGVIAEFTSATPVR
ncbi:beta-phosphoglucomutase family hydrolase [Photobacterium sp. WH77]|uniref:HAD family hydrolase n=1 Tax=Photobacterium TaxID=657 RepID=UPI001EDC636B|nr:beta-phosphoglucomutase family hydrolase [Photobacterium arenosum]MCG2837420.1 beta-phosphoglucomutase family hydrolase [Photobacterium sp. WH77]MCG2845010.1 beta-phosphoglucomutase family hydrolase [Photobacterium sp. WH80]